MKTKSKGQIVSFDTIIALSIATLVFVLIISKFNHYTNQLDQDLEYEDLYIKALAISDLLVRFPGEPINWNSSNIETFGLSNSANIIDQYKWNELKSIPYNESKEIFNLGKFDFRLQIMDGDTIIDNYGVIGDSTILANIVRVIKYQDQRRRLYVTVWE